MIRLLLGSTAILAAALGWSMWRAEMAVNRAERAEDKVASLEAQLGAEKARVTLLRAEMESDNAVDEIPDAGLADAVDPRWLFTDDPGPR